MQAADARKTGVHWGGIMGAAIVALLGFGVLIFVVGLVGGTAQVQWVPMISAMHRAEKVFCEVFGVALVLCGCGLIFVAIEPSTGAPGASPPPASVSSAPSISPSAPGSPSTSLSSATTPPPSTPPPSADPTPGQLLGAYPVNLPTNSNVVLGKSAPKQSDFNGHGGGDIFLSPDGRFIGLQFDNHNIMYSLPPGTTPTYQACIATSTKEQNTYAVSGAAFCDAEAGGKMAGVTISSLASGSPYYVVLDVKVWQN
jgi:hypothetical protein